ncbi:MAG: stage 0 sporulation protein, partial [[Clostridium] scindens]
SKISGVCGRLMCCLTNEEETYEELNSRLPSNGDHVTTPEGLRGDVQSVNVLRQQVKVIVTLDNDEKEIREYKASELRFKPKRKKKDVKLSKEELAQLKALEEKNGASKLDDE